MNKLAFLMVAIFLSALPCAAQVASGGGYTLDQAVIASGGGDSAAGGYSITGTVGQPIAGHNMNGDPYAVNSGFWTPVVLVPTAATARIDGRVLTVDGRGIRNVTVELIGPDGAARNALTGPFGYFSFTELESSAPYTLSVRAKRYQFTQETQVVFLMGNVTDLSFVALPEVEMR